MERGQTDEGASGETLGAGRQYALGAIDDWIATAQPGARLIYFTGVFAGEGSPAVNEALRAQAARGMVYLVQRRVRHPSGLKEAAFDYLAIRSSRPIGREQERRRTPTLAGEAHALFANNGRGRRNV